LAQALSLEALLVLHLHLSCDLPLLLGAMAAVCELARLSVSAHGVAFEVDIKNPEGAEVMTPVRARLEKEATSGRPLPRLLHSTYGTAPQDCLESPQKEGIAERARARNEKKQAVTQRVRRDFEELIDLKRTSLERDLERAAENRQTALADKSSKAGKHFDEVKAKVGDVQRQQADAAAESQRRLEETLAQKGMAQSAGIAERSSKACQHNGHVADKVQKHQEQLQRRLERLREQQQAAQQKADELREQIRCKGSTRGVACRPASAPTTPNGKTGSVRDVRSAASMPPTPSGHCNASTAISESSTGTP